MVNSDCVPPDKSNPYSCNTSDLSDGCIFNILDLNLPTRNSHQCSNSLERFFNRGTNGEVFITDGRGACFSNTHLYDTTTHINSYFQVAFHKLASIQLFDKNPDGATIIIVSENFISALHDYEYTDQTPEVLDERTCLTLLNSLTNPVANLCWHIKICERV